MSARCSRSAGLPSCRFGQGYLVATNVRGEFKVASRSQIAREPLEAVRSIMLSSYEVLIARPGLMSGLLRLAGCSRGASAAPRSLPSTHSRAGLEQHQGREALCVLIVNTMAGGNRTRFRYTSVADHAHAQLHTNFHGGSGRLHHAGHGRPGGCMAQGAEIGGANLMSDPCDINRDAK